MLIVTKTGGRILEEGLPQDVALDVKQVLLDHNLVFVHGGGIEVTDIATKLGKPQRFIVSPEGFRSRYTDKETAEIYTMVMAGKINKQIIATLQRNNVPSIGLSGLDGLMLRAKRKKRLVIINERGRKMVIDGGYTGTITDVNSGLLALLMKNGYVPVVSPIAISEEFEPLNVDGDRVAARIAGALEADILVLLTDVDGLILDGELVPRLSAFEVMDVLPQVGPGMITKIHAASEALKFGVKEVILSSGLIDKPISSAIEHKVGTVIDYG